MAIKLTSLKRDTKRENDGDWVEIPELIDPSTGEIPAFLVRGLAYGPFTLAASAMRARLQRRHGSLDGIPNEVFHKEHGKLLAQHILLDWRQVSEDYSRDLAMDLLCDPASPVQVHTIRAASEVAEITQEFDSDDAKNSASSSVGRLKAAG